MAYTPLTYQQGYAYAIQAGASPAEAEALANIMMTEQGQTGVNVTPPGALGPDYPGERSYGPLQINLGWNYDVHAKHGVTAEQAMDPAFAFRYGLQLLRDQGIQPWAGDEAVKHYYATGRWPISGGGDSMPGSNPFPYGSGEGDVNAGGPGPQAFAGGAAGKTIQGTPITDANGRVISYMVPSDNLLMPPHFIAAGKDQDAVSTNAAAHMLGSQASMVSAKAQKLNAILSGFSDLVKAGQLPFDQAMDQFKAAIAQATLEQSQGRDNLNRANYEETARRERETSEATRRLGVAQEAGRRAETVSKNILPFLVPGATSMNLPMLGSIPLTQVNPDQLFNQGGVGDLSLLPTINPNPSVTFPGAPPLNLPPMPQPTPIPSFQDTIKNLLPYL